MRARLEQNVQPRPDAGVELKPKPQPTPKPQPEGQLQLEIGDGPDLGPIARRGNTAEPPVPPAPRRQAPAQKQAEVESRTATPVSSRAAATLGSPSPEVTAPAVPVEAPAGGLSALAAFAARPDIATGQVAPSFVQAPVIEPGTPILEDQLAGLAARYPMIPIAETAERATAERAAAPVAAAQQTTMAEPEAVAAPATPRTEDAGAPQPVPPAPRAPSTLTRIFNGAKKIVSERGKNMVGKEKGTAVSAELTGDGRVAIDEADVSAQVLLKAYMEPTSGLRDRMAATVDHGRMITDDRYAIDMIVEFFKDNTVVGLCQKHPITNESDAHTRVIRAHDGPGVAINPIVHAMWNADFDGDTMAVSFDETAIAGAKSAMDFLIGTDGKGKIDADFFSMAPWGQGEESTIDILKSMFGTSLTNTELKNLAKAIDLCADSATVDQGFRSMLMWVRAIGNRLDPAARDASTASVLGSIWRMNTQVRLSSLEIQAQWDYLGPVLQDAFRDLVERGIDPELSHLLSEGSPASSVLSYGSAVGSPVGFVPKRNAHFRFISGLTKIIKVMETDAFDLSPRRSAYTVTPETHLAKQISGLAALEDSGRALAQAARDLVLRRTGRLDISSDAAFQEWLQKFLKEYNFVATAMNAAIANYGLNASVVGYERMAMPIIRTDSKKEERQGIRSQFLRIYGRYTMGKLFGRHAPAGWENVRLSEYVQRNNLNKKALGNADTTEFDKIAKFIGRLADLRTSFSKKFDERLVGGSNEDKTPEEAERQKKQEGVLEKLMEHDEKGKITGRTIFAAFIERRQIADGRYDYDTDLNDLAEMFFLLGKDMFVGLGLHNAWAFMTTELGQKFINATSVNKLGGVLYEAVARYRFQPIAAAEARILKAIEKNDAAALERASSDLESALNELASSSDTWAAVVAAYRDPTLITGNESLQKRLKSTDIFRDVLFSDTPKTVKDKYINKLVRDNPALRDVHNEWEVAYGLFSSPSGTYSGMRFTDDQGHTTLLDNLDDSANKIDRWAKTNYDSAVADVEEARKNHLTAGHLKRFLQVVVKEHGSLVLIDPHTLADAAIVMEPSTASGEKAQQEQESSYSYESVGYLTNGGTFSDAVAGGDLALGKMSIQAFQSSPVFVAKVLTDPEFSIDVYDETGVETPMNMMEIFGSTDPEESEVWAWLERHPRAAESLRMTTVNNRINNKTGFSHVIATLSLSETMSELLADRDQVNVEQRRAMKALADHPGFYGMLNLTVAMTGKKRIQVRQEMIPKIGDLIDLIRGMHVWNNNTLEYVRQVAHVAAQKQGMEFDWDRVETAYQAGKKLEDAGDLPLGIAPLSDVRFTGDYQLGQLLHRLAEDLQKYSEELMSEGFVPGDPVAPADAADLLNVHDQDTIRGYFNAIQKLSGAKTAQSTSVNGAMSKLFAGLMTLSRHTPPRCGAPEATGIPLSDFMTGWHKYVGQQVRIPATASKEEWWIPVNEVNVHRIRKYMATEKVVYLETPADCLESPCACKRHATSDPSTNFGRNQTASIGRFLTVLRSLSTEGLNLKVKTVGDDGTDSIVKFKVFDLIKDTNAQQRVKDAYNSFEPGVSKGSTPMAAARLELASVLQQVYKDMGYKDELTLNDYVNVAQILIRPVYGPAESELAGQEIGVKVLSIGQVAAIVDTAIRRGGASMTMERFVKEAQTSLAAFDLDSVLDVESVLAGVRIARKMPYSARLTDKWTSATERSFGLMYQIQLAVGAPAATDYAQDRYETGLINSEYAPILNRWRSVLATHSVFDMGERFDVLGVERFGEDRYTHRIVGVFPGEGSGKANSSIGPRNSWIINAKSKHFVKAMTNAYERGLNILLEGEPTDEQWAEVAEATGKFGPRLDRHQGIAIHENTGFNPTMDRPLEGDDSTLNDRIGTFISTFDIRLNGANTLARGGAHDAGVFHAPASSVSFFLESIANELNLSDSEFAACRSWLESIDINLTGDYAIKMSTAFAGFIEQMEADRSLRGSERAPRATIMDPESIMEYIIAPAFSEDSDGVIPLDFGTSVEENSAEHTRFAEALQRYASRLDEIDPESGLLLTAKPGDIIGWIGARWNDEVRFHPIRLYETENSSGAPTDFAIKSYEFNQNTQELVINWEHKGTMEGRTFKLLEDLYSADKFIGRAVPIEDIEIGSGLKLAGMIARQSTASRRLFMRKPQLMMTLMYMARMEPFGYNLAEDEKVLTGDDPAIQKLKERLLSGDARIGEWIEAMTDADGKDIDLPLFRDDADLNKFANDMARRAIRYNINPTVVFASRYERNGETKPSELWFNFQVLFEDSSNYQGLLMKLMNRMNKSLCPPGVEDVEGTLFNANLQILVPVTYYDQKIKQKVTKKLWVDVFGGFHFFDEHYTGASNAGARVDTYGLPAAWANLAGKDFSNGTVLPYRYWAGLIDMDAMPNMTTHTDRAGE